MKFRLYTKSNCPYCHAAMQLLAEHHILNEDYIVRIIPHEYTSSVENEMLVEAGLGRKNFSRIIMDGKNFINSEIVILSSLYDIEKALK